VGRKRECASSAINRMGKRTLRLLKKSGRKREAARLGARGGSRERRLDNSSWVKTNPAGGYIKRSGREEKKKKKSSSAAPKLVLLVSKKKKGGKRKSEEDR